MSDERSSIPTADKGGRRPSRLTRRERRKRIIALVLLLLLIGLLAYATYFYFQNRRLPSFDVIEADAPVQPPQYLYSITGSGANAIDNPVGVGVSASGRVYAVDFEKRRINAFTTNGRFLFSFEKTDKDRLRNPIHLWVTDDEVWVTDRRYRTIFIFDLNGRFKREFKPANENLDWSPLALAFSDQGELRVTDVARTDKHRLIYFSAEGSRTATVGKTWQALSLNDTPGGFYFPNGLAVAKNGEVFVSDGDNRRIQVFDKTGEFKRFIDTSGIPRGIAIDEKQMLYVVDAIAHTIDIYSLEGERLTQFGSRGFGPGQFNYPNDVAIDSNRRIYVTDRDNDQIQVWGWPTAAVPPVAIPDSPWAWLCLSPLLLLPLLLLLRKIRVVVTPEFINAVIDAGDLEAIAKRKRLRLVAPEEDAALYEGRIVDGVDLGALVLLEPYSESDMTAMRDRYELSDREAILFSMALRERGLASEDKALRKAAALVDVRTFDLEQFRAEYLDR